MTINKRSAEAMLHLQATNILLGLTAPQVTPLSQMWRSEALLPTHADLLENVQS